MILFKYSWSEEFFHISILGPNILISEKNISLIIKIDGISMEFLEMIHRYHPHCYLISVRI